MTETSSKKPRLEVVEGDIRRVGFARFDGSLDLISGGPPCQPFSLGGRPRPYDDARDMFPQAVRAVREARPKAFVFENVKGFMRASFQNYFEYVQLQMEHPEMVAKHDENWEDHLARLNAIIQALDLSRFDAAPLIAFTATKEIDYGTETDGRIPQRCKQGDAISKNRDVIANI